MNGTATQWKRRAGYGGPESFPEDQLAEYAVARSSALSGQSLDLHLEDGRVLQYSFADTTLTATVGAGETGAGAEHCEYDARESAPGIFFLKHGYNDNERLTTCLALDLNRRQAAVIDGEIPAEGDSDYRVRKSHVGGCIGEPPAPGVIPAPSFPPDLVGKNFVAQYSDRYAWEVLYMNESRVAWQGLKGNPGIGDTEEYRASSFAPGVYAVSWSEDAETLAAVFLYNFNERTITGHMWGYAPDTGSYLHAPLGGKIVDPRDFGIEIVRPDDEQDDRNVKQANIDVVLRAHHEVWNEKRYDRIPDIYARDFRAHFICGLEVSGLEGVRDFVGGHHRSFPDWSEQVLDIVADGDRVVTRYHSTGTHKGEFQGIAPTGRWVEIAEVSVHRVLGGKIVEQWGFPDGLSHYLQLTE